MGKKNKRITFSYHFSLFMFALELIFLRIFRPDALQQHGHHSPKEVVLEDGLKFELKTNEIVSVFCLFSFGRYRSAIFSTCCHSQKEQISDRRIRTLGVSWKVI